MMQIPFALAFTAGLVATVNPCGFAMLPAYLAYFMGLEGDGEPHPARAAGRGLVVGAVVSAGFLTVFGVAGVLITLGVQAVVGALPWAAMVVGVGVAVLGVAMLFGFELTASLPKFSRGGSSSGLGGVYVFGLSYAVASLSCTLPIFLVVVAGTIPQLGFVSGVLTFLVYGLGMSMLLVVVTLALAFGKVALVGWLRRSSRHINRVTGAILVVAGAYIVWFWATTLASGGLEQSGAVVFVEQVSSLVTNLLGDNAGLVAAGLAVAIAGAAALAWVGVRRGTSSRSPGDDERAPDQRDSTASSDSTTST
jgi:cytochrome c-type biogenesis protein